MTAIGTSEARKIDLQELQDWVRARCTRSKVRILNALSRAHWTVHDLEVIRDRSQGRPIAIQGHLSAIPGIGHTTRLILAGAVAAWATEVANGDKPEESRDVTEGLLPRGVAAEAPPIDPHEIAADLIRNGVTEPDMSWSIHQRLWWIREQRDYIQKVDLSAGDAAYDSAVAHPELVRAVRPLFQKARVIWYPVTSKLDHTGVVDTPNHGPAIASQFTWTFRFQSVDDPGDFFDVQVASTGWSWKFDGFDKGPGKASTYADKYALMRVLGLEAGDDPDFTTRGLETEVDEAIGQKITAIRHLLKERDGDEATIAERQTLAALARKHSRPAVKNIFGLPEEILDEWLAALRAESVQHPKA